MNKILLVRGFNTNNIDNNDTYAHIYMVLKQKNNIEYFNYLIDDDILSVYKRLCETISNNLYTHLIGHSMGGGLLMKYAHDEDVSKFTKVILLMPLVYKSKPLSIISNLPFIKYLYLPKALMLPKSKLINDGNILNDDYSLIPVKQIVGMYQNVMLDSDIIISTLNQKSNIVLFYAKQEAFNTIPNDVLNKINKIEYLDGLHESFNDLGSTNQFFARLLSYL